MRTSCHFLHERRVFPSQLWASCPPWITSLSSPFRTSTLITALLCPLTSPRYRLRTNRHPYFCPLFNIRLLDAISFTDFPPRWLPSDQSAELSFAVFPYRWFPPPCCFPNTMTYRLAPQGAMSHFFYVLSFVCLPQLNELGPTRVYFFWLTCLNGHEL